MLREMDSAELSEWMAYATLDPFGEERADYRAALICATVDNSNPHRGRRPPSLPKDFLPRFGTTEEEAKPEPQTMEQQKAALIRITAMLGGTIK